MIKLATLIGLSLLALGLSACGFTPLYGNPTIAGALAAVEVVAPQGRAGALVREHLDDALARDSRLAAKYRLALKLSEQRFPRGVRIDNVATRYEYVLLADYVLMSLPSERPAKTGRVRVEVTYDSADQPYASVAAEQDAQNRAAAEAARKIELDLATWLAATRS